MSDKARSVLEKKEKQVKDVEEVANVEAQQRVNSEESQDNRKKQTRPADIPRLSRLHSQATDCVRLYQIAVRKQEE